MVYGNDADRASQACAGEIMEDFPSIRGEFEVWAELYASERIVGRLIDYWMDRQDSDWSAYGKSSPFYLMYQAVFSNRELIGEMLDDWADKNIPLTKVIDHGINLTEIAESVDWQSLCELQRGKGILSEDVFKIINTVR